MVLGLIMGAVLGLVLGFQREPPIQPVKMRCLQNAMAVDVNIHTRAIPFVSRCNCCAEPQVESLDHLLLYGDLGKKVWSFFASVFNMHLSMDVASAIIDWHSRAKMHSYGHTMIVRHSGPRQASHAAIARDAIVP